MILLDTHALVWLGESNPRLGERTRRLADEALQNDALAVSAITFWELAMLKVKNRVHLGEPPEVIRQRSLAQGIREVAVDGIMGVAAARFNDFHGDPADRIIAATAVALNATLLTADRLILGWHGRLKVHDART